MKQTPIVIDNRKPYVEMNQTSYTVVAINCLNRFTRIGMDYKTNFKALSRDIHGTDAHAHLYRSFISVNVHPSSMVFWMCQSFPHQLACELIAYCMNKYGQEIINKL